jgi:SAM-dependent methyltransferase
MSKIVIGIPCFHTMPPETETDYLRLMYYLGRRYQEHEFFLAIKRKSEQFRARNSIVEVAAQMCADYVWFLDDDHVFDEIDGNLPSPAYEHLRRLLEHFDATPDAGIIGCLYYHRGGECRPVLMTETAPGRHRLLFDYEVNHQLQEVAVQGGGCMLIKMEVFDKLGYAPFAPEHDYGTDIQVCMKAREAGYKVYCDTSLTLGHVKNERSIVTARNRHQHMADYHEQSDAVVQHAVLHRALREFRADVKAYLNADSDEALAQMADPYLAHKSRFSEFADPREFYRSADNCYLARAAFIHHEKLGTLPALEFDSYVLQTIRMDKPGRGLDFGCGSAPVSFELARRAHEVWFCDIKGSPPFEFLKWRANKNKLGTKAHFLDVTDNGHPGWPKDLDYVLALDSLEHLQEGEWQQVLQRIAESLRDAGCLITNFILLNDNGNNEHIFMDKPRFVAEALRLGLYQVNPAMFQKRGDLYHVPGG